MNKRERVIWREALRATSLGWDLALPIFGGVLVGYLLDEALPTRYLCTLGFLALGTLTGFYNVIRSIQRLDRRSRLAGTGALEQQERQEKTQE